jgi:hypothetical protein
MVKDSDNATDTESIQVMVVPAGDQNRFLSVRAVQSFDDVFTVTAALEPGTDVGTLDVPFTVIARRATSL